MTTVTRRYALYKAQKGAYIADLEQLQASISLPSTIKMVFSLQQFTKISILLVLSWSFYYTGSQASKREYALVFGNATQTLMGAYPRSDAAFVNFDSSTWPAGSVDNLLTILKGGKEDKQRTSNGVDSDGDMLLPIPHPNTYDENPIYGLFLNGTVNNTVISHIRPSNTVYMSLGRPLMIGRNETDVDQDKKTFSYRYWEVNRVKGEYDVQTSYIMVNCLSVEVLPADQFPKGVVDTLAHTLNVTEMPSMPNSTARQLQFWQRWGNNETIGSNPMPLINGTQPAVLKYTCDLLEPQIKVHVQCSETACLAAKMEFPRIDQNALRTTPFANGTFSTSFFDSMLLAGGIPKARNDSGIIYSQLYSTLDSASAAEGNLTHEEIESDLVSQSGYLETVINAYVNVIIKANTGSQIQTDNSYAIENYYMASPLPPANSYILSFKGSIWEPHYQLYWQWAAIDYVASALLLVASIISFWLRKQTLAPDIFGFVSSLTRDNPHFPVPVGGSTLDGISRARALRSLKVKIADISTPQEGHGRLGFVPVVPTRPTGVLHKDRKYL